MGQNRWVQIDRLVPIGPIGFNMVQNQPKNGKNRSGTARSPSLVSIFTFFIFYLSTTKVYGQNPDTLTFVHSGFSAVKRFTDSS